MDYIRNTEDGGQRRLVLDREFDGYTPRGKPRQRVMHQAAAQIVIDRYEDFTYRAIKNTT